MCSRPIRKQDFCMKSKKKSIDRFDANNLPISSFVKNKTRQHTSIFHFATIYTTLIRCGCKCKCLKRVLIRNYYSLYHFDHIWVATGHV